MGSRPGRRVAVRAHNSGGVFQGIIRNVCYRMLQPHELSAAMGFPRDYVFTGTREERVKQIGNAVAVNMARALCRSVLAA